MRGAVVVPSHAAGVVTPAYDALTTDERRRIADEQPDSFLSALPADTADIGATDFAACRATVDRLVATDRFRHRPAPFVALYRLRQNGHEQTALLCDLDASAVDAGMIVGHEHTRTEREQHLVDYLREVQVASSPVCVMHPPRRGLRTATERAAARPPDVEIDDGDLRQELWIVDDPATTTTLLEAARQVGPLVITDGHHRTAAARRFADEAVHPSGRRLLVAMFDSDAVQIREFNRAVTPLDVTPSEVVIALAGVGITARELDGPEHPQDPGTVTMTIDGVWWQLIVSTDVVVPEDPLAGLDVSLLHELVLGPVLGVTDPRTDPRLRFVPGVLGLDRLAAEADGGVGFALHPIDTHEVARIALSGRTLPPKSTYLDPKARSGLLLLPRR